MLEFSYRQRQKMYGNLKIYGSLGNSVCSCVAACEVASPKMYGKIKILNSVAVCACAP